MQDAGPAAVGPHTQQQVEDGDVQESGGVDISHAVPAEGTPTDPAAAATDNGAVDNPAMGDQEEGSSSFSSRSVSDTGDSGTGSDSGDAEPEPPVHPSVTFDPAEWIRIASQTPDLIFTATSRDFSQTELSELVPENNESPLAGWQRMIM